MWVVGSEVLCVSKIDLFERKDKVKIPVAKNSLGTAHEGTTMGQIPQNVSLLFTTFSVGFK